MGGHPYRLEDRKRVFLGFARSKCVLDFDSSFLGLAETPKRSAFENSNRYCSSRRVDSSFLRRNRELRKPDEEDTEMKEDIGSGEDTETREDIETEEDNGKEGVRVPRSDNFRLL